MGMLLLIFEYPVGIRTESSAIGNDEDGVVIVATQPVQNLGVALS